MKPGSKGWKKFMAKLYGFGAAVVIVGALFKIMHWPFAGPMLIVGLSTEALIFIFSAFEPIHEDPNWELVYPELALGHSDDLDHDALPAAGGRGGRNSGGSGITEHLDKMLEEAKIDGQLLERLGDGMRQLGENAAQLKGVTSAAAATDSYVSSLQAASDKVSNLSEAYERASVSISGMTSNTQEGESFGEQMQKVSKNLSALNNVYELQLKGSSAHLEATEKFQGQVTEMMKNLSDSAEDTKRYKENMAMLSKNLTDLNSVYGNMLKAMTISRD
ncbi:gliding motility protein GldL [Fluviicola taffensis]|uniref:Gliding motility-associated protein GldL n=1 Tax=Fluviicola taffensis (strain DSM 16823 / NCIMB 13979 / RW262) TaxID=755732 RepID=F2IBG7_FLUTR|nr:gliding motility protein GldL [Fluviicola taffensis]AEA44275.1 gliding motility-associated protein GldL [Fluviicola taffensis DSM 16823]